jgi:thioesterase domain-containing protein
VRTGLGEIEADLAAHPAVVSAVVVDRGAGEEAELAAYAIPRGVPVTGVALRQYLAQRFDGQTVPATVTLLAAFPLTAGGEIDREALPAPTREPSGPPERTEPRTALERKLATIWERELDIAAIGVTDDLFDLGVTSLVAARLFAAIEHALDERLPPGAIFTAPSIERLAAVIEARGPRPRWSSLVPIQPAGSQPPIFCVHGGGGTILHLAPLARQLGRDQPFYGLQSRGLYGGVVPPATVEDMASLYLSEMREVHREGPWRLAGYCFGALVAFEMARQLVAEGEQVELLAMFNGPSPAWIRKWRWYGNQPSKRTKAPAAAAQAPADASRTRGRLTRILPRIWRALREPRRFGTALVWHSWRLGGRRLARLARTLGRPLPEQIRDHFFLRLHADAERVYAPRPYGGDLLVFYGDELYEDPELGWGELVTGEIRTCAVPGDHRNNRQALVEPYVGFVGERLQAHLGQLVRL